MSQLTISFLIALVAAFGTFDYQMGTTYIFRPITLGPIVGMILGDVRSGLIIGANLELIFMGSISVGGYLPPDVIVGGVLGTAYAISQGGGVEIALAFAMPIALLSQALGNLIDIIAVFSLRWADNGVLNKDYSKVKLTHRFIGIVTVLRRGILVFLGYYLGSEYIESILGWLPDFVLTGLEAAAGLLPALGFAMLLGMIFKKQLIPYFFIGFVLSAYLGMDVLGIAIIAISYAVIKFNLLIPETALETNGSSFIGGEDDDF